MNVKAAVVFEREGEFKIGNLELSEPGDDDVMVRIAATDICRTDLAARDEHLPIPIMHLPTMEYR
jgi:aryl-alcohol dehydrogenase